MTLKFKEQVEATKYHCPFCHRILLYIPSRFETAHEDPVCQGWLDYCKEHGAKNLGLLVDVEFIKSN